jgi:hypothetical protein
VPGTHTRYVIDVRRREDRGPTRAELNGVPVVVRDAVPEVPIHDDGETHHFRVELGVDCARRYRPLDAITSA